MEILNDLTKCNFYYYILRSNKAYLIFNYLQSDKNSFNCIGDAFIRRQPIKVDNKIIRFLNNNLKQQYKEVNTLKSDQNVNLNLELNKYIKLGYLLVIQYLVSKGANIHAVDDRALRFAAQNGHLQIVQYLVNIGTNIHAVDDYALGFAAVGGYLTVVQYLVNKGANIHAQNDLALKWAAGNGHLAIVQYLVSIGANINVLTAAQKLQFNII